MRSQRIEPQLIEPERGILVLSGYGIDVRVERGQLKVEDGIGTERRAGLLHRALSGLERLVIIGHTGTITLDAVRWLDGIGASLIQLGRDGEVLGAWRAGGYEQPRLRRQQAKALGTAQGTALARWLIIEKLTGQLAMVDELGKVVDVRSARAAIEQAMAGVERATDDTAIRYQESAGAVGYWSAWAAVPVRFTRRDAELVPAHWLSFGSRASAITRQPRLATTPGNALLNYLYAILETEAVLAARTMGLDPGLGVYHVDAEHRPSLAADLMEPVRAAVDRYLLELLTERAFGARDFFETRQGVVRLTPGIAKELIVTGPYWGRLVGRVTEELAERLMEPLGASVPKLITRPRGKPARHVPRPKASPPMSPRMVDRRCAVCGVAVGSREDRTCSAECLEQARIAQGHAGWAELNRRLRAKAVDGVPPQKTPQARAKLGRSQAQRKRQQREWEAEHPERPDEEVYWREVYPVVRERSVRQMLKATGLSTTSLLRFKRGSAVPHPMWWERLVRHDDRLGW